MVSNKKHFYSFMNSCNIIFFLFILILVLKGYNIFTIVFFL